MLGGDRNRYGLAAVVVLGLLGALFIVNIVYVSDHIDRERSMMTYRGPDSAAFVITVPAEPGERLSVMYDVALATRDPVELQFLIAEPGAWSEIRGIVDEDLIYFRWTDPDLRGMSGGNKVELARPGLPEGGGAGEPVLHLIWWVQPEDPDDADGEAMATVRDDLVDSVDKGSIAVTDKAAVQAQPWFYAGEAALGAAFLLLAGMALRPRSEPEADEPGEADLGSLVSLVAQAEGHLIALRGVLWLTGALLLFLGFLGIEAVDNSIMGWIRDASLPGDAGLIFQYGLAAVYLAVVVAWGWTLWRVHRALTGWRAKVQAAPLDL